MACRVASKDIHNMEQRNLGSPLHATPSKLHRPDNKNAAHSGEPIECHNTFQQQCPAQTSLQSMKNTLWRASRLRRHLLHRVPSSIY